MILTSHELAELSLCNVMYVLKDGKLEMLENGLSEQELIAHFK